MSRYDERLDCVVAQIRQERETRKLLERSCLGEGRKEQIVEKRKAQIRRQYGFSMDSGIRV